MGANDAALKDETSVPASEVNGPQLPELYDVCAEETRIGVAILELRDVKYRYIQITCTSSTNFETTRNKFFTRHFV